MRKCIFLIVACALFSISNAQESKVDAAKNDTTVVFDKSEHDFGTISVNKGVAECEFVFTNTGDVPIVITKVTASCGCTAPDWTKEPIASGKQGFIKVSFDPKNQSGEFNKSLVVFTNGNPKNIRLKIKGFVE